MYVSREELLASWQESLGGILRGSLTPEGKVATGELAVCNAYVETETPKIHPLEQASPAVGRTEADEYVRRWQATKLFLPARPRRGRLGRAPESNPEGCPVW